VTSLLFFASILFHEMSQQSGSPGVQDRVDSITLFVLGSARIGQEASNALQNSISHRGTYLQFFSFRRFFLAYEILLV